MMKRVLVLLFAVLWMSCSSAPSWRLVWEDHFDGSQLDSTVWSLVVRGKPDWQNTQSSDPRCFRLEDGLLTLRGIVNDDLSADTAAYLTGGIWTKYKKGFHRGRIEVRAKLGAAQGAWPAIWMRPFDYDRFPWPKGGEIDIMERLNHDSVVYQTVHSPYTHTLGIKDEPLYSRTAPIQVDDFNVYGVDMYADSIVFHINGQPTHTYPRIETELEGQFPFDHPMFLIIDMQLGGNWVGRVEPDQLPVEMQVDWVKYYEWR